MFRLTNKFRVCRRFNEDIWGEFRTKQVLNKTFMQFVRQYKERRSPPSLFARSTVVRRWRRRSLYGELINFRKKMSIFYGGLSVSEDRWNTSQEQILHKLFRNISSFESRLSTILYRSHFCSSVLESLNFILSGKVCVNKRIIRKTDHVVCAGDIFELVESAKYNQHCKFMVALSTDKLVVYQPRYLEINHLVMAGILLYSPVYKEAHLPFYKPF
jgi:ribosomal protein S4